jgi:hypothetical protein
VKALLATILALLGPAGFATANLGGNAQLTPQSVAPTKVAWYDATRPSSIAPAAPMPGVAKTDLLVEGLTINTALLPISLPIPTIREVTAYTALQFHIPDGATPGSLTLHLTGFTTASIDAKLPSGVTPIACPVTSSFKSGAQQATNAAPKYDCSKRSTVGQIGSGGKTVTFPGISRLLTGGNTLSVVILPGSLGLERLVFAAPGKDALSLLDFTLPATTPTPATSPTCCAGPPPTQPPTRPGGAVPTVALPSGVAVTPSAPSPVIASSSPAMVTAAVSRPDDGRERTRAIGLLIALVAATAWFAFTDRRGHSTEMGVGRFRAQRSGPPPTI